jgi:hypothetical protein
LATYESVTSTDELRNFDLPHVESGGLAGMNLPATYYSVTLVLNDGDIIVILVAFMVQGGTQEGLSNCPVLERAGHR